MFSWKGKSRAVDNDEHELLPVITFKHMHSHNLGVKDPLRVVALCDSDAFYASCEQVRLGLPRDTPLVVLQWSSFIAVSYEARKYGISRFGKEVLTVQDAKEKCPDLVVVHVATYKEGEKEPGYWDKPDPKTHKVSLDHYRRESKKVHSMFKNLIASGVVEKASIDEAFLDFTQPVREIMLQRYPELSQLPEDMNTPLPPAPPINWKGLGYLIPVHPPPRQSEDVGSDAENEFKDDEPQSEEPPTSWHDVALSIAAELMDSIRKQVDVQLGYTTSAGIARNKFLAKLAASNKKPNGQSILRNAAIPNYLRPLPFQKIRFLGGKLGKAIAEEFEASTVGDLLGTSFEDLRDRFGDNASWVYEILRGIDRSEVKEKSSANTKSMSAAKNLPQPITKASEGHHWLRVLAAELALRLNDARAEDPTLWPKTISLGTRKGYGDARSKQAPFPFHREVTVDLIATAADKLWKELVGADDTKSIKVTAVYLSFSGIQTADPGQQGIEGFLKPPSKRKRASEADNGRINSEDNYACPRCKKEIPLPTEAEEGADLESIRAKARQEHDDYHFAQDLAKEAAPRPSSKNNSPQKKKAKKASSSKPADGGIARFFSKPKPAQL